MIKGITLHENGIELYDYYLVTNGFISACNAPIFLHYKDVLHVERVRQRNKKTLYISLLLGGLLGVALNLDFIPLAANALLALFTCMAGAAHLFSARTRITLTTMQGTYQLNIHKNKSETAAFITHIQRNL